MRKLIYLTATLCLGLFFNSCGTQKILTADQLNGEWNVIAIVDAKVETEEIPFIGFNTKENRLYGCNGCNNIMGSYTTTDKGEMKFGQIAGTMKACKDSKFEMAFMKSLDKVKYYKSYKGNKMELFDAQRNPLMLLVKRK